MNMLMYLPMIVGSGAMMLFYMQPGQNRTMLYLSSGIMAVSMVVMAGAMLMRAGQRAQARLKGERRDYLRYLGQMRKQVRRGLDNQRAASLFTHPDPGRLWAMVPTDRLWERRATHADFAEVRIGLGQQRLAMDLRHRRRSRSRTWNRCPPARYDVSCGRTRWSRTCRWPCICAVSLA